MSKVRFYKLPTAAEVAAKAEAEERRYASLAGMSLERWLALREEVRNEKKREFDKAVRRVKALEREKHYASCAGLSVEAWRELDIQERRKRIADVKAAEKAERAKWREQARERAAIEKLKIEARKAPRNRLAPKPPPAGLPGTTRLSTITGLMASPSDKKWKLFLQDGPYWNYLVNYIRRTNIFRGRDDLVSEAVMNTCEKIGKFMISKRFKYQEAGKGYFRAFLKIVALRSALELLKAVRRQEQIIVEESKPDETPEFDKIHDDMLKSRARRKKVLEMSKPPCGLDSEISPASERDLDAYDRSAGFNRVLAKKKPAKKTQDIVRLDEDSLSDMEGPSNNDIASLFGWRQKVAKEDIGWVQKLQIHVLYIALGYILTDDGISAERREMLRLRYGQDKTPQEIYKLPRFSGKTRNAFDVQMKYATDDLRREVASWWKLVAPDKNDFSDEIVMRFWRELGRRDDRAALANDLQDKAIDIAGRID